MERCADLKGLEGFARDRYVDDAVSELRARQGNALLRTIAPDRTQAPRGETEKIRETERRARSGAKAMKPFVGEIRACVTDEDLKRAREAVRERRHIPERCLRSCPSYALSMAKAPVAVGRAVAKALASATESQNGRTVGRDRPESRARTREGAPQHPPYSAIGGDAAGIVLAPAKTIVKGMIL